MIEDVARNYFSKIGVWRVSVFEKGSKRRSVNDQKGAPEKWRPFRPRFWKKNFWEHLWSQRGYSRDYFKPDFRSLGQLVSILWVFFVKGAKNALRNTERCHSKAHKMETIGPRDLKLSLKKSLEYPLRDQRCSQKFFFRNWGLNGLHFWQRAKKSAREPRVQSLKTM